MTTGDDAPEPQPEDQESEEIERRPDALEPLPELPPLPPDQAAFWAAWYYSGPIPLPQIVDGWERVLPGAADRIMSMAEREQGHAHEMDRRALGLFGRGQIFALILGLAAIAVGGIFGGGWGFAVIVTAVGGIIGAFLLNRRGPSPPFPPPPPSPPRGAGADEEDETGAQPGAQGPRSA